MENRVGYAKDDLMVPPSLSQTPVIAADLGQLNQAAATWCVEVNAAVQ